MTRSLLAAVVALFAAPVATAQAPPLRWGADVSGGGPYIFQTDDGAFTGFEWDFAAYLGKKLGRTPDLRKGDWDKLPQRLDLPADGAEGIDIVLNGYEFREDLSADYAPSRPYFAYRLALVVHADDDRIRGWSDLPGKSVGVLGGSAADDFLIRTYAGTIDRKVNPDVATVMGLVENRRLDATVQDGPAATHYLRGSPKLKEVGDRKELGYYVVYARKSDPKLIEQINAAIADGYRDGSLQRIYRKYGLWNEDQKRLGYAAAGVWPADAEDAGAADPAGGEKANPWPRMLRELLEAAGMTVFLSVTSFPLAMALGLAVALGRVYGPWAVAVPLRFFVEAVRGTPLLLQLYAMYYLVPDVLPWLALTPIQAGILGLAINYAAYEAENYRAGLLAVPKGQMEAALALGMTPLTAVARIVVPQAVRVVIPPVTNDFIALFKDTSVCSVILITELTRKYNELYNFNRGYIVELAVVTAGLYLVMSYPMAVLAGWLEARLQRGERK